MGGLRPGFQWLAAAVLTVSLARADDRRMASDQTTAISAKTFNGYLRHLEADGTYSPETYGVAVGGLISMAPSAEEQGLSLPTGDPSIDRTTFAEIGGVVERALSAEQYVPTAEPQNAKLLIVVYWGRTAGTNSFSGATPMNGQVRDRINQRNALLLGFGDEGHLFDQGFDDPTNMMANIRRQVHAGSLTAVEDDRYVVILEALDFQKVWKHKQTIRLWETRFSLSQRHGDFREGLPKMAQAAEHFFGTDSKGISYAGAPSGHVEIGPLKSLGEVKP